jgi:predicted nuclease of predicted toxin-antitoxin system
MRFLVDECTGPAVAHWLKGENHEVFSVFEEARGMSDPEILTKACQENWILITNDKDFGEKIYREKHPHKGVILLRLEDERAPKKIKALQQLLDAYSDKLENQFIVVTETHVRFAQPSD